MRTLVVALLIVSLVVPIAAAVAGKKHRNRHDRRVVVEVRDYMPEVWQPYVVKMVDDFNAALPKRAPRLVYRDMPEAECERSQWNDAVVVCPNPTLPISAAGSVGTLKEGWGVIMIQFSPPPDIEYPSYDLAWPLCHEFMHVVTGIPDDYSNPQREASCVHGILPNLGPFDIAHMQEVFKKRRHR